MIFRLVVSQEMRSETVELPKVCHVQPPIELNVQSHSYDEYPLQFPLAQTVFPTYQIEFELILRPFPSLIFPYLIEHKGLIL